MVNNKSKSKWLMLSLGQVANVKSIFKSLILIMLNFYIVCISDFNVYYEFGANDL